MDGTNNPEQITWTASEFIAHEKTGGWYVLLAGGASIVAALLWFMTKDWVTPGIILFAAFIFGFYASRKPRELTYALDHTGLNVGPKRFLYKQFRSFSSVAEGGVRGITFMPLKRFGVPITIYYDPTDEEKITNLLVTQLPFEERQQDAIDRLMWRIRF